MATTVMPAALADRGGDVDQSSTTLLEFQERYQESGRIFQIRTISDDAPGYRSEYAFFEQDDPDLSKR